MRFLALISVALVLGCSAVPKPAMVVACSPVGIAAVDVACELLLEQAIDRCSGGIALEACTDWLVASAVCLEAFRVQDRRCP